MAQYNGNWHPPTFGMWIVRVRITSVPQFLYQIIVPCQFNRRWVRGNRKNVLGYLPREVWMGVRSLVEVQT